MTKGFFPPLPRTPRLPRWILWRWYRLRGYKVQTGTDTAAQNHTAAGVYLVNKQGRVIVWDYKEARHTEEGR